MAKRSLRIFLDSNVMLSGLVSWRGAPRLILDILSLDLPVLSGLTGRYNLIEIERNIEKKMPAALPIYRLYLPKLKLEVIPMPSSVDLAPLRGATEDKDLPVLASAISGRADFFISGDKKLLSQINQNAGLPFKELNPAEFLNKVLPKILVGERRDQE